MFSLSHKLIFLVWGKIHHKPVFSYKVVFLLEILYPLRFQAELCGWRRLGLYWMCCVFPENVTGGDSVAVFLQSQALLHSSRPSPTAVHCPQREVGVWVGLYWCTWAHSCPFLLSQVTSKSISFSWPLCFVCFTLVPTLSFLSSVHWLLVKYFSFKLLLILSPLSISQRAEEKHHLDTQRLLFGTICPYCESVLVSELWLSWHGEGSGQVCAASPGLYGSVPGLQVRQVSEQQLFSPSKDHSILQRKGVFFLHT